ncbi:hypothetical protein H5410_032036 [Solanum commersonii]|uniref:Uncharacterized protein n=1 Tax=Solanum commersonii TaxID=4109 RepID=A0A9J5YJW6_SOLCO|nr:hypothetical protein H5410_032036 [Solanum commersonii]
MCRIERWEICLNYLLIWKNIIRMRIVLKIGMGKKQHLHCERLSDMLPKCLPRSSFFVGLLSSKHVQHKIISTTEASIWIINAICVRIAQKQSITCSFTVQWPRSYGICSAAFWLTMGHIT